MAEQTKAAGHARPMGDTSNTIAMAMATIVSTFDSASVEGSIPTAIRTVPVRGATPMAIRTTVPVAAISAVAVAPVSVR